VRLGIGRRYDAEVAMPSSPTSLLILPLLALLTTGCGPDEGDDATGDATTATTSGAASATSDSGDDATDSGDSGGTGGATTCESVCPQVLEAACTGGPVDLADCESGCAYSQMTCPAEFATLATCLSAVAPFGCDASGRVVQTGCETEYTALYACLGVP
jgi:hypothetical protein